MRHPMHIKLNKIEQRTWSDDDKYKLLDDNNSKEKVFNNQKIDIIKNALRDKNKNGIPDNLEMKPIPGQPTYNKKINVLPQVKKKNKKNIFKLI